MQVVNGMKREQKPNDFREAISTYDDEEEVNGFYHDLNYNLGQLICNKKAVFSPT